MLLPTVMVGCVLPAARIHWTMAPAAASHRPVAADCVFLQSVYKKTSHSRPLLRLSCSSMKDNIEDEVITLADGKPIIFAVLPWPASASALVRLIAKKILYLHSL